MKYSNLLLSVLALASIAFFAACGDDDDEPSVDPIVGIYSLSSVTLNQDIVYNGMELSNGDDITQIVQAALYGASPCDNGANTVIDLRESFEVFYACKGESVTPERFGTWIVNADRSQLSMNLTIEGNPFLLVLEQLSVTENSVSGVVTNYPLVELKPGESPPFEIKQVNVDIDFMRTTL
ncbi:MAG: hypothetical protein P8X57_01845 [Cyclobacteriaceae bacterium]